MKWSELLGELGFLKHMILDVWKAESRNTVPHPTAQYFKTAQPAIIPRQIFCSLKSWTKTENRSPEAREAIHIRRNNSALNHNIGKMNIPIIFNQILNTDTKSSAEDSTNSNNQPKPIPNSSNRAMRATNLFH